jgi:hypothetical protein
MTLSFQIDALDPTKHYIKQGNTGPALERILIDPDSGLALDLTDATVMLMVTDSAGVPVFYGEMSKSETVAGKVSYTFTEEQTETVNDYLAEIQVRFSSGVVIHYPGANEDSARNYIRLYVVAGLVAAGFPIEVDETQFDSAIDVSITLAE